MAKSWSSASGSSSSSYQLVGRDPLDDEEQVVLLSDTLSDGTNDPGVAETSNASGDERTANRLQDLHLAAAAAEEDFAADWILGSSNYYFTSTPAMAQPTPAPSPLLPPPPEVASVVLSGPVSPHHHSILGERSGGQGRSEGMMHQVRNRGSSCVAESSSSAQIGGDNEGMQTEGGLAGSLLDSEEEEEEQQQQQQQQRSNSNTEQMQGCVGSGSGGSGAMQELLASMAALEQERDALAARMLDTDSALSASEGALRSLSAQHASTRTLLAELASHTLLSSVPPPLPAATTEAQQRQQQQDPRTAAENGLHALDPSLAFPPPNFSAAAAGAAAAAAAAAAAGGAAAPGAAAGAALPDELQQPASPRQDDIPQEQALPDASRRGSGTAAAAAAAAAPDGPATNTCSPPCPPSPHGAASATGAQEMVRDAVAGAESGDSEAPAFRALLLLALFGLAWLMGTSSPPVVQDPTTSPASQRPQYPPPAAPAPASTQPPLPSSQLRPQQPLQQQTFMQWQQQQQQHQEQCVADPSGGDSCFPTIAVWCSEGAGAGAGVSAQLPWCCGPRSLSDANRPGGSGHACNTQSSASRVSSMIHDAGFSSALVQRLHGGLVVQEMQDRHRAGPCSSCRKGSSSSSSSSSSKTSTSLVQNLVGTQLMLPDGGGPQLASLGSMSLSEEVVKTNMGSSVACWQELCRGHAIPGLQDFRHRSIYSDGGNNNEGGDRQQLGTCGWAAILPPSAPGMGCIGQEGGAQSQERQVSESEAAGILSSSYSSRSCQPNTHIVLRSRSRQGEERVSSQAGMRSKGMGIPVPCQQWRMGSSNREAARLGEPTPALHAEQHHCGEHGESAATHLPRPTPRKLSKAGHAAALCSSACTADLTICKTPAADAVDPGATCTTLAIVPHSHQALGLLLTNPLPTPHHSPLARLSFPLCIMPPSLHHPPSSPFCIIPPLHHPPFAHPPSPVPPTHSNAAAHPHKFNPHTTKQAALPHPPPIPGFPLYLSPADEVTKISPHATEQATIHPAPETPLSAVGSKSAYGVSTSTSTSQSGISAAASSAGQPGPSSASEAAASASAEGVNRAQLRRGRGKQQRQCQQLQLRKDKKIKQKQRKEHKSKQQADKRTKKLEKKEANRKLQKCQNRQGKDAQRREKRTRIVET